VTFSAWNRKTHYWLAILCALPVLLVILTGLLLQVKKQVAWIQPPEKRGSGEAPRIDFATLLNACRTALPEQVRDWGDINRIDVRPKRGLIKVTTKNHWEIQLDAGTGQVLQVAYRRSDIIEALHDGSWFSDTVRYGVFLPSGILLLLLWVTGIYLFFLPIFVRRRKRQLSAKSRTEKTVRTLPAKLS
jgi:uncharacterized iron-regulated membrane protein